MPDFQNKFAIVMLSFYTFCARGKLQCLDWEKLLYVRCNQTTSQSPWLTDQTKRFNQTGHTEAFESVLFVLFFTFFSPSLSITPFEFGFCKQYLNIKTISQSLSSKQHFFLCFLFSFCIQAFYITSCNSSHLPRWFTMIPRALCFFRIHLLFSMKGEN